MSGSSDIFLCTQIIAALHLNSITTCDRVVFLGNDIDKKVQFCRNAESTCLVPAKFASFGAVCSLLSVSTISALVN